MSLQFKQSAEVIAAKKLGGPIVALESTIITHGMPYPDNLAMAQSVEQLVRDTGATPATIAVLDGTIHIGLDKAEMTALAQASDVWKLSRADLPAALALGANGATTVAATMICANLSGISVFATGGIGGVHRGAAESYDVSADLMELSKTPVTVVCAGAKAILDIPKTFEMLETLGVTVFGYQCDELPAFWSRNSGIPAPLTAQTPKEIADSLSKRKALGLAGGQLVCNPIPVDAEIPRTEIDPIIISALKEATKANVSAKDVTPFLLQSILEQTEGRSLQSNIALMKNNAQLAAQIAIASGKLV